VNQRRLKFRTNPAELRLILCLRVGVAFEREDEREREYMHAKKNKITIGGLLKEIPIVKEPRYIRRVLVRMQQQDKPEVNGDLTHG